VACPQLKVVGLNQAVLYSNWWWGDSQV